MIRVIPASMIARLGWTSVSFALVQLLRLLNNVVLARLLAPSLFGLMVIVNAIRTGVELLSDMGINQNIVSNKRGESPEFYDTAWTLQVLRGFALGAIGALLAGAAANLFEQPELAVILPLMALLFVLTGFQSTSLALLNKRMALPRSSTFEVTVALISLIAHVALALITPTIWALVLGTIITGAAWLVGSFLLIPGMRHRFMLDRSSVREIVVFGKWIFVSSIIYFFSMNFDRLYFAKQVTLAELGVYGIARSLADMISGLGIRASSWLVFPTVAAMQVSSAEVRSRLLHGRRTMLLVVAVALACFVAGADLVVGILYDPRYADAAIILPLLLLAVWFAILCAVNDSILLGSSMPAYPALSNGAKLLTYLAGVPIAFHFFGFTAAVLVIAAGEVVRYLVLWMLSRRRGLGFGRDDLALSVVFVITIVLVRKLLWVAGITGDIDELFPMIERSHWSR